jgi:hypothetical protein
MGTAKRTVLKGMAGPVKEIVADVLGNGCTADGLSGYIVIGLQQGGFQIASNAGSDEGEYAILCGIVQALRANLDPDGAR